MWHEAKEEYRGMFETQKSGNKTNSGEIGLDIRTHASPKVGQDQVSVWVSVLCWHTVPIANVLLKPRKLGNKSNSVIMSQSVTVKNWCNVLSMEGVTVYGHHPEWRVTFGRGNVQVFFDFLNKIVLSWRHYFMTHDVIDNDARLVFLLYASFSH